jgi:hypothetical protein
MASIPAEYARALRIASLRLQCADPGGVPDEQLSLLPDPQCRNAKPFVQLSSDQIQATDLGDYQELAVLATPSLRAPTLVSTLNKSNGAVFSIASFTETEDSVLKDPGHYNDRFAADSSGIFVPPNRTMQVPKVLRVNDSVFIPFHSAFAADNTPGSEVFFLTCTRPTSSSAAPFGFVGMPFSGADRLTLRAAVSSYTNTVVVADLFFELSYMNSAGVNVLATVGCGSTGATGAVLVNADTKASDLVDCIALTGMRIRNTNGSSRSYLLTSVDVLLTHNAAETISPRMQRGLFSGSSVPDLPAFSEGATAARFSALSMLLTNTSNMFNANGSIFLHAVKPGAAPAEQGLYSLETVTAAPAHREWEMQKGGYIALDLTYGVPFTGVDALPRTDAAYAMMIVQGTGDTPMNLKLHWAGVVEIVGETPLFRPRDVAPDPDLMKGVGLEPPHPAALVICENPSHWKMVGKFAKGAGKFLLGAAKFAAPIVAGAAITALTGRALG